MPGQSFTVKFTPAKPTPAHGGWWRRPGQEVKEAGDIGGRARCSPQPGTSSRPGSGSQWRGDGGAGSWQCHSGRFKSAGTRDLTAEPEGSLLAACARTRDRRREGASSGIGKWRGHPGPDPRRRWTGPAGAVWQRRFGTGAASGSPGLGQRLEAYDFCRKVCTLRESKNQRPCEIRVRIACDSPTAVGF